MQTEPAEPRAIVACPLEGCGVLVHLPVRLVLEPHEDGDAVDVIVCADTDELELHLAGHRDVAVGGVV